MKQEAAIAADYGNIAGMVVRKDGETVYERYFGGCTAESRLNVFSVTKSIISILLGIALDRGCLGSIDQQVLEFFPEYTPKRGEKAIQRITIRDMLTMTAPYKYRYAPLIGPDILTGILTRVTGQSVLDFAKEHLFAPLGIPVEQSIPFRSREELMAFYKSTDLRVWAADPAGVNAGGWGLTLSPMDLAKLGQLYLDGGIWNGQRLVSERWVRESTAEQSRWAERDLPYGYLWWVLPQGHGFAAMGDGGNALYVSPDKNLVAAITSRFQPRVKDRIELIRTYVGPALTEKGNRK